MTELFKKHLEDIVTLARQTGALIMEHYEGPLDVVSKDDGSPVTHVDQLANQMISEALETLAPDIPIIAEEGDPASWEAGRKAKAFWLVDPIDGTKEFIRRTGEFCVNIALVEDKKPVLGVIHSPTEKITYVATKGDQAYMLDAEEKKTPLKARARPKNGNTLVVSRLVECSEGIHVIKKDFDVAEVLSLGSALKMCFLAEGKADLYVRAGRTMEWDTAAGHIILEAVGGQIYTMDGNDALLYGKAGLANPPFVAWAQIGED